MDNTEQLSDTIIKNDEFTKKLKKGLDSNAADIFSTNIYNVGFEGILPEHSLHFENIPEEIYIEMKKACVEIFSKMAKNATLTSE